MLDTESEVFQVKALGHRNMPLVRPRPRPSVLRSAFTLIEILAVLAIIGMLAAILMPALADARRNAHRALCACHLREIGQGLELYAEIHDDRYPTAESSNAGKPGDSMASAGEPDTQNWWQNRDFLELLGLTPNHQGRSILTCPADLEPDQYIDGSPKNCWTSYGANTSAFGMRRGRSKRGRHRSWIQYPAKALAFCDVRGEPGVPHVVGWQPCVNRNFSFRHNERCTAVYVDTHVDWIRYEDVPRGQGVWSEPFWGNVPFFDTP